jgi:mannosyltransferase
MTGPKQWLHSRQKFDAIRLSDAVICVSHSTRNDLLRFIPDVDPDLVHVVYNGVSDSFFPLPSSSSNLNGLRSNYVLYVGSRASYKNFTIVVQSLSSLPSLFLVCVGGGSLSHREKSLLDKLIPLRFKHYPFASQDHLNVLYNNAYCLAYPSSYEGFGIPILEAMRAGCPVIAVNTSSIPEVSGSAALLLARPTAEELSHALLNIGNRELRNLLRSQGFVQSKPFSWDRCFADTMRVYEAAYGRPLCS